MKKTICTIIILLSFSVCFALDPPKIMNKEKEGNQSEESLLPNVVKLNVSSLVFKSISLQYERVLSRKIAVALGFRITPNSTLPLRGIIEKVTDAGQNTSEVNLFLKNTTMSGFALTPEFRYYLGKGSGQGLYIAPFLRYENIRITSVYPFKNEDNRVTDIDFNGNYKTFGAGILLGSQFRISNRLTLDWWIMGPYVTAPRIKLDAAGYNLSATDLEELRHQLEDTKIEIGSFKIKADIKEERTTLTSQGTLAALRGFGVCLGIKF